MPLVPLRFLRPPILFAAPPFAPSLSRRRTRRLTLLGLILGAAVWLCLAVRQPPEFDADSLRAAAAMRQGMDVLKAMRARLGLAVEPALDPAETGFIGADYTDLTTTLGSLSAKQTSLNPAFAALVTAWLKQAGLQPGDRVAVCLTGSFPALNLAALCACEALDLRPLVFSSVGASSYGANLPDFTWLDMEHELLARGVLRTASRYASLGGIADSGGGLSEGGYVLGEAAIARHGAEYVREGGQADVRRDVERRMKLYDCDGPSRAFLNVGGNVTALGWVSEAALLDNGLLRRLPTTDSAQRGVIFRMAERGTPVLHLLNIERLALRHGLPVAPRSVPSPEDGRQARRARLAWTALLLTGWLGLGAGTTLTDAGQKE